MAITALILAAIAGAAILTVVLVGSRIYGSDTTIYENCQSSPSEGCQSPGDCWGACWWCQQQYDRERQNGERG